MKDYLNLKADERVNILIHTLVEELLHFQKNKFEKHP